jgi:SSS family solute:Na+ symporter
MSALDILPITVYALIVLGIGLATTRRGGEEDYLLGGRRIPAPAVLLSLVATELSAATYIGVPESAYGALAWTYLQFGVGSILARLVLGIWVIPLYHRRGVRTVYEFIGQRYGPSARLATAWIFLVGRLFASSVRLFIAGTAFALVSGLSLEVAVLGCGGIAAIYAVSGGIRAVIWTDAFQGLVLLCGAGAILAAITAQAPGGAAALLEWTRDQDAARLLQLELDGGLRGLLASSSFVVSAVAGGFFLTLATHSTDHDMVQRLLTTRTGRAGGAALVSSGFVNIPVVVLFLSVGTGLAALHALEGGGAGGQDLVASFVRDRMEDPWRGLVVAGLFAAAMSSLDSAICAIGATWTVDIAVASSSRDASSEAGTSSRARRGNVVIAALLVGGAIGFSVHQSEHAEQGLSLVEVALSSMGIVYGALLGLFAMALLSRRGRGAGAVAGLCVGGALGVLLFLQQTIWDQVWVAWVWRIPICALVTMVVIALFPGGTASGAPGWPESDGESDAHRR